MRQIHVFWGKLNKSNEDHLHVVDVDVFDFLFSCFPPSLFCIQLKNYKWQKTYQSCYIFFLLRQTCYIRSFITQT